MEQDFLAEICPGAIIRRIPANGDDVSLDCIAARTAALIKTLPRKSYPIFVVLDREGRDIDAQEISTELEQRITQLGVTDPLQVYVADRDTESWIMSDANALIARGFATEGLRTFKFESDKCKGKIKAMYRAKGLTYSERADGTKLLADCSAARISSRSKSFAALRKGITQVLAKAGRKCSWLER
jgi:hypothetical protein